MRALVLGAYGHYGTLLCRQLRALPKVQVIGAGRDYTRLIALGGVLDIETLSLDMNDEALAYELRCARIDLVIHVAGPFQGQDYRVAQACIEAGCYYVDLADCPEFVQGIKALDADAKQANVFIGSGMGLTALFAAIIAHQSRYTRVQHLHFGFSGSGRMPGLASVKSHLYDCGKAVYQVEGGRKAPFTGLQGRNLRYFGNGAFKRDLVNLNAPDIQLFSDIYRPTSLRYQGGFGVRGQRVMSVLARCTQYGWIKKPERFARQLKRLGGLFERFSGGRGALYLEIEGHDGRNQKTETCFEIHTRNHKSELLKCVAIVAFVRRLMNDHVPESGARPALGEVRLDDCLKAMGTEDLEFYNP